MAIRLPAFLVILMFAASGCITSQVRLNYAEVNQWGREHLASITLLGDTTKYMGTGLRMARDSTVWKDIATQRVVKVPSYQVTMIKFDRSLFPSFTQVVYSVLIGAAGFLAVGVISSGSGITVFGFIAGFFLSTALNQENVFIFHPDPIAKQYIE